MEKFNIGTVLDKYQPDINELAAVLFPDAKYPRQAFARVVKGEAQLDTGQIERLAAYLGVLVQDLFAGSAWSSCNEDGCMCFIRGAYKAKLNYMGVYLTLYKDGKVLRQCIGDMGNMPVNAFTDYLDTLIKEYENH